MEADGHRPPPETILFVEDEVLTRLEMSDFLRQSGYQVTETAHAAEALDVLKARLAVDLVLTDIRMPGEMDGFALTRWIKENRPGVRVVIQSGESVAMPEDLAEFGPILPKPYTGRDLLNRVKFELSKVSAAMIPPSGGGFRRQ